MPALRPFFIAVLLSTVSTIALSEDPKANAVLHLFTDACVPNMGQPDKVRSWAADQHLQEISAPAALELFVGAGAKGVAWAVPISLGSFALSIRGTTEACAVWARAADPGDVAAGFEKLMDGVRRPGLDVGLEKDTKASTLSGEARTIVYHVRPTSGTSGYAFTLLTAERSGGPFQASLQVARASIP